MTKGVEDGIDEQAARVFDPELHAACIACDCKKMKKFPCGVCRRAFAQAWDLAEVRKLVDEQADDIGLWFAPENAPEAYLQQELRKLHAAIESLPAPEVCICGHERETHFEWGCGCETERDVTCECKEFRLPGAVPEPPTFAYQLAMYLARNGADAPHMQAEINRFLYDGKWKTTQKVGK